MILLYDGEGTEYYRAAMDKLNIAYTEDGSLKDQCDGLLVPGGIDVDPSWYGEEMNGSISPDKEHDKRQLDMIDYFVKNGKKVMGICRGHQIINVYFKGSLIQDLKTEKTHWPVDGKESVHGIEATDYLEKIYQKKMIVNSTHHQAVNRVGEGLIVIARDDEGVVEAMRHETLPVISVQFHPERMFTEKGQDDGYKLFSYFDKM